MEASKICFKCGEKKAVSDFYIHKKMGDGRLNKCKDCTKLDTKNRHSVLSKNNEWIDSERKRHREKYHRLNYLEKHKPTPEKKKEQMQRYIDRYPEKMVARISTSKLVKKNPKNQLHHWSYNKNHRRDVIELSVEDHYKLHRYIIYDQERMMYRTMDGVLLDTKERHMEYFESIKMTDR